MKDPQREDSPTFRRGDTPKSPTRNGLAANCKRIFIQEHSQAHGVENRGAPSSWIRGYLKEETTTQGGGKGVVGKYQKYQLRVTRKYKVTSVRLSLKTVSKSP